MALNMGTEVVFIAIAAVLVVVVVICALIIVRAVRKASSGADSYATQNALQTMREQNASDTSVLKEKLDSGFSYISNEIKQTNEKCETLGKEMQAFKLATTEKLGNFSAAQEKRFADIQKGLSESMQKVKDDVNGQLAEIRKNNDAQLEKIRNTVDEKLQKTLNERITESFKLVNEQLGSVQKGLGEMQSLAQNVGDLKKVMTGVKTRGTFGEVQLQAILEEILAPGQYEINAETRPNSGKRVEFAIKIPGKNGESIYLPIDSKFPADSYEHLQDARDTGDSAQIEAAWKQLETTLKIEAKDVHDKYIEPPFTTNFAIIFLPFEGLYAEIASRAGLLSDLQRKYSVNIAGPSTMAALLNSLQMGFQTVEIQKRAGEIQKVLEAVKAEMPKFKNELEKAQRQLNTAQKTIGNLIGPRTNAMEKTLRGVTLPDDMTLATADKRLGIEAGYDDAIEAGNEIIEAVLEDGSETE